MSSFHNRSNPCFHEDNLVHMANNTYKKCSEIKKGLAYIKCTYFIFYVCFILILAYIVYVISINLCIYIFSIILYSLN